MKKRKRVNLIDRLRRASLQICTMCRDYEGGDCTTCEWRQPINIFGFTDYIVSEDIIGDGLIIETVSSGTIFRFQERIVCVVTEDYVMKTADVPYSAVADFLDLVFGEMDEEEWNDLEVYDDE